MLAFSNGSGQSRGPRGGACGRGMRAGGRAGGALANEARGCVYGRGEPEAGVIWQQLTRGEWAQVPGLVALAQVCRHRPDGAVSQDLCVESCGEPGPLGLALQGGGGARALPRHSGPLLHAGPAAQAPRRPPRTSPCLACSASLRLRPRLCHAPCAMRSALWVHMGRRLPAGGPDCPPSSPVLARNRRGG
jgi:hypothetical protein